jgi:hypothetical protein
VWVLCSSVCEKISHEVLRRESSPIELLTVEHDRNKFQVLITTRRDLPMYTLRGYKLRALFFSQGNIAVERQEMDLPDIAPGSDTKLELPSGSPKHPFTSRWT